MRARSKSTSTKSPRRRPARRRAAWSRPAACFAIAAFALLDAGTAAAAGDLVLIPDPRTLLILLVGFVALIFPLNSLLFKPVFAALDAREERIAGARSRSAQLQSDADRVLEQYETAIREARRESEATRQGQLERAREEQANVTQVARRDAESELERARGELARSLEDARVGLRASAEDLAQAAAERVLGRSVS